MTENIDTEELVSIHCMTYNQVEYLKECFEGFINQKTNFKFVVYVGDDASSDGTIDIIKEYEKLYPELIKGIYHTTNTRAEGNFFDILKCCNGKYLIFCEGDDYWTDENKLQKQVDFMEENPEYSICFHGVLKKYEDGLKENEIFPSESLKRQGFTFENLLRENFIQTNSALYRRDSVPNLVKVFPKNMMPGDWYINLLFAKAGKIEYSEDVMSVYRVHKNGAWGSMTPVERMCRHNFKYLNFYLNVYKNIANDKKRYMRILVSKYNRLIYALFTTKNYFLLTLLILKHPILFIRMILRISRIFCLVY